MNCTITLKPKQLESFKSIFVEYATLFNRYYFKMLRKKTRVGIQGKTIKKNENSNLSLHLLNSIGKHFSDTEGLLRLDTPYKWLRLTNIRLFYGQFIFNYVTFTFPGLDKTYNYNTQTMYCDIKICLHRNQLIATIDEESIEIINQNLASQIFQL